MLLSGAGQVLLRGTPLGKDIYSQILCSCKGIQPGKTMESDMDQITLRLSNLTFDKGLSLEHIC